MRSVSVIILSAFMAQVQGDDFSDKVVEKLMDKLADRLNQMPEVADLDSSTLGKAHPDMAPSIANVHVGKTLTMFNTPTQPMMGCPTQNFKRGSQAANAEVKLGSDSGALVFQPDSVTIKVGETVKFVNNVGFPHNIVFDEDEVPDGVEADKLGQEEYLNAPGETKDVKFEKAGTYQYYCEPHRGAGMKGKIIVQ